MIGPETAMAVSAVSTGSDAGAGAECTVGAEAALVTAGVEGFVSPQPVATRTAENTTGKINLRILFPRPLLPAKPEPYFFVHPNQRPPEKGIARGIPADTNFSAAFHSHANRAVGMRYSHASVKNRSFVEQIRFRADNQHVAAERASWIAVQLHDDLVAFFQQSRVHVRNGHIHDDLRCVHNFGE